MNRLISVAVPTRHRIKKLDNFITSFKNTTFSDERPHLTIIHDNPTSKEEVNFTRPLISDSINVIHNLYKSSLAQLWNQCIINAPTDWVLVCNDDAIFKQGWLEYLTKQIFSDKYKQINLLNYGGMCLHKSWIVRIGWFDEQFEGGGYEDVDYQLRISELKQKHLVDMSNDFVFLEHRKDSSDGCDWEGRNNSIHIVNKWGRKENWNLPSYRWMKEIDWHPKFTSEYIRKYSEEPIYLSYKNSEAVYP